MGHLASKDLSRPLCSFLVAACECSSQFGLVAAALHAQFPRPSVSFYPTRTTVVQNRGDGIGTCTLDRVRASMSV